VRTLASFFELDRRNTTVAREVRGGLATFLTMAYILFANPGILAAAGVPMAAAAAATALAAGCCSILMGVGANFPLALAPGMGLNAVIAFQVAAVTGSWQTAMGLVVLDGLVVLALVLLGLREAVMHAIPQDLRRAIAAGIGLFIAFIGAVNARLVVVPAGTIAVLSKDSSVVLPPVTHGHLGAAEPLIALFGIVTIAWLLSRKVAAAIVLGILASTLVALLVGVTRLPQGAWLGWPQFDTLFAADWRGALDLRFVPLLLAIVMVDFFDTIGTVTAVADAASLHDEHGRVPHLRRILAVDAISASVGGAFGASSVTSYIESASGIAEGARTGLHTVTVGVLFLAAMVATPLLGVVPAAATAPALIVVGFLMCAQIVKIDFTALGTAIPAFLTLLLIPLTYSISHGIGAGFIAYVAIAVLRGEARTVHPLMYATSLAFCAYFALA
jgi:AGZA family xanthine/uracil permease-like MFS transporter